MIKLTFTDPAIGPILLVFCIGLAIASLEDYRHSRNIFGTHGILSWDVLKFSNANTLNGRFWKFVGLFQALGPFRIMLLIRMLLALGVFVLLLVGVTSALALFPMILVLLMAHLLISVRAQYGLDGAHQMNLIILGAALLYCVATPGSFARAFCILFIGAQAVISYVVSGIYKWLGQKWRNGTAMSGIMTARIYGHAWLGAFLRHRPVLSKIMCWSVIVFEIGFIATLFGPPAVVYVFLGCGIVFHMLNAVFMGLNGFFFSFVATYPAVIYLNHYLRQLCFGS